MSSAHQILQYRLRMEPSTFVTSRRRHSWPSGPEEECAEEGSPKAFVRAISAACHGPKNKTQGPLATISESAGEWLIRKPSQEFLCNSSASDLNRAQLLRTMLCTTVGERLCISSQLYLRVMCTQSHMMISKVGCISCCVMQRVC